MQVSIALKDREYGFTVDPGERLLYAGLRQGVPLAYECATGTCGTCKATVVTGAITEIWPEAPGWPDRARMPDAALLCQSSAEGDCVLRAGGPPNPRYQPPTRPRYVDAGVAAFARLTHDVALVTLALEAPITFEAGQFVLLGVPSLPGWRAYSLVEGAATARPSFIIKRKPGGAMTHWFFESCREGTTLRLFGPLGVATFRPASDENLVLLAGGSGLSMVLSILDAAARFGHLGRHRADIVFGVRTMSDLFLIDRLADFATSGSATVTVALSDQNEVEATHRSFPAVRLKCGFVHDVAAVCLPPATPGTIAFIAGPPPMIDASLRQLIMRARIPPTHIRYDKFS